GLARIPSMARDHAPVGARNPRNLHRRNGFTHRQASILRSARNHFICLCESPRFDETSGSEPDVVEPLCVTTAGAMKVNVFSYTVVSGPKCSAHPVEVVSP